MLKFSVNIESRHPRHENTRAAANMATAVLVQLIDRLAPLRTGTRLKGISGVIQGADGEAIGNWSIETHEEQAT